MRPAGEADSGASGRVAKEPGAAACWGPSLGAQRAKGCRWAIDHCLEKMWLPEFGYAAKRTPRTTIQRGVTRKEKRVSCHGVLAQDDILD